MTSLIRPGRGLITATWSDRKIASEMPWVTISVVAGFSVQIRSSSRLSRWRVMSSSAPKGSSSSRTDGLTTSDAGDRDALAHAAGQLRRLGLLEALEADQLDQVGDVVLVDRARRRPRTAAGCWTARCATAAAPSPGTRCRARAPRAAPRALARRPRRAARSGCSRPARIRRIVDLPQPDGPSSDEEAALVGVQVDVVEGGDRACGRWRRSWSGPEICTPVPRAGRWAPAWAPVGAVVLGHRWCARPIRPWSVRSRSGFSS